MRECKAAIQGSQLKNSLHDEFPKRKYINNVALLIRYAHNIKFC